MPPLDVDQLAAQHRDRLVRAALRRLGDRRDEAEDVVQEALVSAMRALRAGKRPENPGAWLMAIVVNACNDHHRAAARRRALPLLEEATATAAQLDAHAVAEQRAQVAGAVAAVRALPESQRRALVGFELGGRSYEELAAEHGWTVPATKSLLWRARTTLAGERERWATVIGTPLAALLRSVHERPLGALTGAREAVAVAAVAVVAAGGAGGVAVVADGGARAGVAEAAQRAAAAPPRARIAAERAGAPVRARIAGSGAAAAAAAPAGAGCPDAATPAAARAALRRLDADAQQYSGCAAELRRTLAGGWPAGPVRAPG